VAVGAAVGVAAATTANANAAAVAAASYPYGDIYAALPVGCAYAPYYGVAYYHCGYSWFSPNYGANGIYYRVVAPP
jgi:hypothetical protein